MYSIGWFAKDRGKKDVKGGPVGDSGAVLDRTGIGGMMKKATCEQSSIFDFLSLHFKVLL